MTSHGFGIGKLTSTALTDQEKEEIAECISAVDGVLWSHVVHAQTNPPDQYDLIWEETKECNHEEIKQCAIIKGHALEIVNRITIKDRSFEHPRKLGKHPKYKEEDAPV